MNRMTLRPIAAAVLGIGLGVNNGWAQDAPTDNAAESGATLEEVVVTARRKEENLQDVPVSVTAVEVETLKQAGAVGIEDVAAQTPGFSFEGFSTSGTNANAVIRGLANTFTTARIQNVSFFLDGIYLQRQSMLNFGLTDIERVEVVRGPQSALYGRNAFAGAVNYVSKRPSSEFEGYVQGVIGDNDRQDIIVSLSGPFTESFRGLLTYGTTEYDGHTSHNHPIAHAEPRGGGTTGRAGGWDDSTLAIAAEWDITEKVMLSASYFRSDLKRELQPYYVIGGLRSVANGFRTEEQNDMNCNTVTIPRVGVGGEVTGNTAWCGELPLQPDPELRTREGLTIDPRGIGAKAKTNLWKVHLDWELTDTIDMVYSYGYTDHSSFTNGGSGEEDPLIGSPSLYRIVPPNAPPLFLPFPSTEDVYANQVSGRPVSELESHSHEVRFVFAGNGTWSGQAGAYFSTVEDKEHDFLWLMPICSNLDAQGVRGNGSNEEEILNCYLDVDINTTSPYAGAPFITTNDFGSRQHGIPLNDTRYRDDIWAVYGSVTWDMNDSWSLTAEGRYEVEDKQVTRLTDSWGLAPGESAPIFPGPPPTFVREVESGIVIPEDDETFEFFTPRLIAQYRPTDTSMWYASVAKGVKTGGFNNTLSLTQLTYEEEENWTYEIGSKNTLADGRFILNGSLYYIDWKNLQGTTPVHDTGGSLNSNTVVDNIGDATGYGLELEAMWLINDNWTLDAGYAYNKTEFDDGVTYLAAVNFFHCDGVVCDENGDVSGNRLPRQSEHQLNAGLNFYANVLDGWAMKWRVDGSYQSKQYLDPLNLGWVPDRTLANTALTFTSPQGAWDLTLWGRNIFNEKYAANAFVAAQFNRLIVSLGAQRSWGLTAKYSF